MLLSNPVRSPPPLFVTSTTWGGGAPSPSATAKLTLWGSSRTAGSASSTSKVTSITWGELSAAEAVTSTSAR
jgi:hypothetical protein